MKYNSRFWKRILLLHAKIKLITAFVNTITSLMRELIARHSNPSSQEYIYSVWKLGVTTIDYARDELKL